MSSWCRDNWQRLVEAVMKREQYLELCHKPYSRNSSISSFASDYSEYILDVESITASSSPHQVPVTKRPSLPQGSPAGIANKHDNEEFIRKFYIPSYILEQDFDVQWSPPTPECPVLVFINSRSGRQLGGDLLITYRTVLNEKQVIDLGEEAPDSVLKRYFLNLERLENNGDEIASEIKKSLRIIVAGGDGTAGWLLGVVSDLKLSQPPPIATMPLGTENNLPFAFGWGKKNPRTDRSSVLSFLDQVLRAKQMRTDSWHFLMRMGAKHACDPVAPLELPHSLHAFSRVTRTDDLNIVDFDTFRGGFWSYFSMGIDAQDSYEFHTERKKNQEKFKNQLGNQTTYAKLVGSQGWFLPSHFNHASSIDQLCTIKIMKGHNEWQELVIPPSIKSILCLNLPSFSSGLNPWGTPDNHKRRNRDITVPFIDDGRLEIVGFTKAWHRLLPLAPKRRGIRLAQVHRISFEFHKGAADHTYMRIDGEPWKQPLPYNDDVVVVEISHLGQVKMLATHDCRSKSYLDPPSLVIYEEDEEDSEDEAVGEEYSKFGAADTFKISDEIDISHLS